MKLLRVRVKNFFGLSDADLDLSSSEASSANVSTSVPTGAAGTATKNVDNTPLLILGANGSGKSSVLRAVQFFVEHYPYPAVNKPINISLRDLSCQPLTGTDDGYIQLLFVLEPAQRQFFFGWRRLGLLNHMVKVLAHVADTLREPVEPDKIVESMRKKPFSHPLPHEREDADLIRLLLRSVKQGRRADHDSLDDPARGDSQEHAGHDSSVDDDSNEHDKSDEELPSFRDPPHQTGATEDQAHHFWSNLDKALADLHSKFFESSPEQVARHGPTPSKHLKKDVKLSGRDSVLSGENVAAGDAPLEDRKPFGYVLFSLRTLPHDPSVVEFSPPLFYDQCPSKTMPHPSSGPVDARHFQAAFEHLAQEELRVLAGFLSLSGPFLLSASTRKRIEHFLQCIHEPQMQLSSHLRRFRHALPVFLECTLDANLSTSEMTPERKVQRDEKVQMFFAVNPANRENREFTLADDFVFRRHYWVDWSGVFDQDGSAAAQDKDLRPHYDCGTVQAAKSDARQRCHFGKKCEILTSRYSWKTRKITDPLLVPLHGWSPFRDLKKRVEKTLRELFDAAFPTSLCPGRVDEPLKAKTMGFTLHALLRTSICIIQQDRSARPLSGLFAPSIGDRPAPSPRSMYTSSLSGQLHERHPSKDHLGPKKHEAGGSTYPASFAAIRVPHHPRYPMPGLLDVIAAERMQIALNHEFGREKLNTVSDAMKELLGVGISMDPHSQDKLKFVMSEIAETPANTSAHHAGACKARVTPPAIHSPFSSWVEECSSGDDTPAEKARRQSVALRLGSGGYKEGFLVLVAVLVSPFANVFIDEPGHNLHPGAQAALMNQLERAVTVSGKRIVVVTHSERFINKRSIRNAYFARGSFGGDAQRMTSAGAQQRPVRTDKACKISSLRLLLEELELKENDYEQLSLQPISQLLLSSKVLLVEGSADGRIANMILNGGEDPSPDRFDVIACLGSSTVPLAFKIACWLGLDVKIMLDLDTVVEPLSGGIQSGSPVKVKAEKVRSLVEHCRLPVSPDLDAALQSFGEHRRIFEKANAEERLLFDQACCNLREQIFRNTGGRIYILPRDLEEEFCSDQMLSTTCRILRDASTTFAEERYVPFDDIHTAFCSALFALQQLDEIVCGRKQVKEWKKEQADKARASGLKQSTNKSSSDAATEAASKLSRDIRAAIDRLHCDRDPSCAMCANVRKFLRLLPPDDHKLSSFSLCLDTAAGKIERMLKATTPHICTQYFHDTLKELDKRSRPRDGQSSGAGPLPLVDLVNRAVELKILPPKHADARGAVNFDRVESFARMVPVLLQHMQLDEGEILSSREHAHKLNNLRKYAERCDAAVVLGEDEQDHELPGVDGVVYWSSILLGRPVAKALHKKWKAITFRGFQELCEALHEAERVRQAAQARGEKFPGSMYAFLLSLRNGKSRWSLAPTASDIAQTAISASSESRDAPCGQNKGGEEDSPGGQSGNLPAIASPAIAREASLAGPSVDPECSNASQKKKKKKNKAAGGWQTVKEKGRGNT